VLSWSGLPVVEVRSTAFLEGLFLQLAGGVATHERFLAPLVAGKNSTIAAFDVARAVAEILSDPEKHVSKTTT